MDITVTAAYTDTVLEYCLRYSGSGKGGTAEVLSPPSVAGLVMEIREADGILICDGMRLDTGIRGGPGITPVGICPVLWKLWTEGYGTQCRFETREGTETLALQLEGDDGLLLESWFDRDTHLPIFCGVLQDGVQVLTCSFSDAALIP